MAWHWLTSFGPAGVALQLLALAWQEVASLLALAAPLVAVPLGAMTFYLRSIRDQQVTHRHDFERRLETLEADLGRLARRIGENERDFTTKEDWLRESMLARQNIERLAEAQARLEAGVDRALATPRPRVESPRVSLDLGAASTQEQR